MSAKQSSLTAAEFDLKNKIQASLVKAILPVLLTVILCVITLFGLVIPRLEILLMERKREMIQALTESAWGTVKHYADMADAGQLSPEKARNLAIANLRNLRYGPDHKDYFWINDMQPRMVMHPYRPDLEAQDISMLTDRNGKHIFVAFVEMVRRNGAGFVDYQWQWQDNPDKVVPKISYVKGFAPWQWIIGTGVYVEDVRHEISTITRRIAVIWLSITTFMLALSGYVIWQGVQAEKQRRRAEAKARLQQEQLYQSAKLASLGTLVSGVAHEINNPISTVKLNLPIFQKLWERVEPILEQYQRENNDFMVGGLDFDQLKQRIPRLLSDAFESAERVKRIVFDLKDFAGKSSSQMRNQVCLNDAARRAVGLVRSLIKKATSNFQENYHEAMPRFHGNMQRIEQVIVNLLVNACQATPHKEKPIRLQTGYNQEADEVFLEIQDEGGGMSAEVLERIKDPFFTTKRDTGGTGLGLSISDTIIRDHGGRLSYASEEGVGSIARISLPLRNAEE